MEAVTGTENHAIHQIAREPHGAVGARAGRQAIAQGNTAEFVEAICRYTAPEEVLSQYTIKETLLINLKKLSSVI